MESTGAYGIDLNQVLSGERRPVARLITMVENDDPRADALLSGLFKHTGRAHIVGVTGSPGTGKSTLTCQLAKEFRRREKKVGIIAVDPTSPFTGGALLGDRIRMQELSDDRGVFIRSMATRGHLGGLSRATGGAVLVLDAAGYDVVIVETVGTGQDEVEIADNAHTTLVVEVPGLGDDIQALKAGILEIADVLVVNKADKDGADNLVLMLQMVMMYGPVSRPWQVPIMKTIAMAGEGVGDLVDTVDKHYAFLKESGALATKAVARARSSLNEELQAEVQRRLADAIGADGLEDFARGIAERETDPRSAARELVARILKS